LYYRPVFLTLREGESLLFPVPVEQFAVRAKNLPSFNLQGIHMQDIETNTQFNIERPSNQSKKLQIPCYFPVLREFDGRECGLADFSKVHE
jgi:hypothetical protein